MITSRVALIVADVLPIHITWTNLSSQEAWRNIRQSGKRASLSDILFRNGACFYSISGLSLHRMISNPTPRTGTVYFVYVYR